MIPKTESDRLDSIRLPGRARCLWIKVLDGRCYAISKSRIYELVPTVRRAKRRGSR